MNKQRAELYSQLEEILQKSKAKQVHLFRDERFEKWATALGEFAFSPLKEDTLQPTLALPDELKADITEDTCLGEITVFELAEKLQALYRFRADNGSEMEAMYDMMFY